MSKALKLKLKENQLTIGSWVTIGHQSIIEIMSTAGFDWLTIDMEHSVIDLPTAQNLIGHIQGKGMDALVRVGKNEEVVIKRILDAGADGVIVPMVNSKEDAIQAINFAKYPPLGKRGVGLARAQNYGIGFEEYKDALENDIIVIAQIEHIDGVKNLRDILSVEGIDGTIIGPYDLSGSMNKPGQFYDQDVIDAIKEVKKVSKEMNKPLGFHIIQPDYELMEEKINDGFNFLAFSLDFLFLGNSARNQMRTLKNNI